MARRSPVVLVVGVALALAGLAQAPASSARSGLTAIPMGPVTPFVAKPSMMSRGNTEPLWRGDMTRDMALGCDAGPSDTATKVTATMPPSFGVVATTYAIGPLPGQTLDLVAWKNGASPGPEIQRCRLVVPHGTRGVHTLPVPPGCLVILPSAWPTFYFGLSQGLDSAPLFFGMDTSGSTPNTVFIRAPGCGVSNFTPVEALGFPGYWVHRIIVSDELPVELMTFEVG